MDICYFKFQCLILIIVVTTLWAQKIEYMGDLEYNPKTGVVVCLEKVGDTLWVGTKDGIVIIDEKYQIVDHIYDVFQHRIDEYPSVVDIQYNTMDDEVWCLLENERLFKYDRSKWLPIKDKFDDDLRVSKFHISKKGNVYGITSSFKIFEISNEEIIYKTGIDGGDLKAEFIVEDSKDVLFVSDNAIIRDNEVHVLSIDTLNLISAAVYGNDNLILQHKYFIANMYPKHLVYSFDWESGINELKEVYGTTHPSFPAPNKQPYAFFPTDDPNCNIFVDRVDFHIVKNSIIIRTDTVDWGLEFQYHEKMLHAVNENEIYYTANVFGKHQYGIVKYINGEKIYIDTRVHKIPQSFHRLTFDRFDLPFVEAGFDAYDYGNIYQRGADMIWQNISNTISVKDFNIESMAKDEAGVLWLAVLNNDKSLGYLSLNGKSTKEYNIRPGAHSLPTTFDNKGNLWCFICGGSPIKSASRIACLRDDKWEYYNSIIANDEFLIPYGYGEIAVQADSIVWFEDQRSNSLYAINIKSKKIDTLDVYKPRGIFVDHSNDKLWMRTIRRDTINIVSVDNAGNINEKKCLKQNHESYKNCFMKNINDKIYLLGIEQNVLGELSMDGTSDIYYNLDTVPRDFDFDSKGDLWFLYENGQLGKTDFNHSMVSKNKVICTDTTSHLIRINGKSIIFQYKPLNSGTMNIKIFNLKGQIIFDKTADVTAYCEIDKRFDRSFGSSGLYIIQVNIGDELVVLDKLLFL